MLRSSLCYLFCGMLFGQGCARVGPPKVIYLARHGQTEWNRLGRYQGDPDLDNVGYLNRVSLWHLLKDRPLATIYTSTLRRTQTTAALVARQHGLTIKPRAELDEIRSGIMEGICIEQMAPHRAQPDEKSCAVTARGSRPEATLKVIQAAYREVEQDRLAGHFPLAESFIDVERRTKIFVDELGRGFSDREVLVVGHGVVNRILLHHFMDWPLGQVAHLRQENDQVFRLERWGNGPPKLSLYTPGSGWRVCQTAPRREQRYLDCAPQQQQQAPPPSAPPASVPVSVQTR